MAKRKIKRFKGYMAADNDSRCVGCFIHTQKPHLVEVLGEKEYLSASDCRYVGQTIAELVLGRELRFEDGPVKIEIKIKF